MNGAAQAGNTKAFVAPGVFQAAGPNIASVQGIVEEFRVALGGATILNAQGPLAGGRREINGDGGGSSATALAPTPFTGFLTNRGALFNTDGEGFVQAPLEGLVTTFGNLSYDQIFQPFSRVRLFSPVGSNVTDVTFFIPGGGNVAATTRGFGAIFSDVDQPDGSGLQANAAIEGRARWSSITAPAAICSSPSSHVPRRREPVILRRDIRGPADRSRAHYERRRAAVTRRRADRDI